MRAAWLNWHVLICSLVTAVEVLTTARAAQALPPVDEVLRQMVERSHAPHNTEPQSYYLCTKQTVTEELDTSGRVTSRKVKMGESRSNPTGAADANKWGSQNGISL